MAIALHYTHNNSNGLFFLCVLKEQYYAHPSKGIRVPIIPPVRYRQARSSKFNALPHLISRGGKTSQNNHPFLPCSDRPRRTSSNHPPFPSPLLHQVGWLSRVEFSGHSPVRPGLANVSGNSVSLAYSPPDQPSSTLASAMAATPLDDFAQALSSSLAEAKLVPGSAAALVPRDFKPATQLSISFGGREVELGNLFRVNECRLAPFVSFETEVSKAISVFASTPYLSWFISLMTNKETELSRNPDDDPTYRLGIPWEMHLICCSLSTPMHPRQTTLNLPFGAIGFCQD